MEEFLTKVAALGRIPEPELGKVWAACSTCCVKPAACNLDLLPSAIASLSHPGPWITTANADTLNTWGMRRKEHAAVEGRIFAALSTAVRSLSF